MFKEKIWNFGIKHAALLKRVPVIRAVAEWCYSRFATMRTNEVFSPHYLERFRESLRPDISNQHRTGNPLGVNIAGFIETENGVGEAVRSNIRAINTLACPYVLNNLETKIRHQDRTFGAFSDDNPYQINLVHVNADQFPLFLIERGFEYFRGKYNIGAWVWELPELPKKWRILTKYFDEIWTPSTFCSRAISLNCDIPVITVPYSISVDNVRQVDRSYFGLKDDTFVFLFMFDMLSCFERKNPLATIESFRAAFSANDNARLVLKIVNSDSNPEAVARITRAVRGLNVTVIDTYIDKDEVHALMSLCDCYVSLHRSEGFGFTLAECMYLKKPVIATAYSGNIDFMTEENSFPVRYDLIKLKEDYGPYKKGAAWAEPDISHAAELMRFTYENREQALAKGEIAAQHIRTNLSPAAVGSIIAKRINAIIT
jgi:glycosyltransferase involved in cell wall biosynthesis